MIGQVLIWISSTRSQQSAKEEKNVGKKRQQLSKGARRLTFTMEGNSGVGEKNVSKGRQQLSGGEKCWHGNPAVKRS